MPSEARPALVGPTLAPPRRWMPWVVVGFAAAATVALVPVLVPSREIPTYRGANDVTLASLLSATPLPRDKFLLRWSGQPEGAHAHLTVATRDLRILYSADLTGAEHVVPAAALTEVPAGAELVFSVEAILPDGRRLQSAFFPARVQ